MIIKGTNLCKVFTAVSDTVNCSVNVSYHCITNDQILYLLFRQAGGLAEEPEC